MRLLHALLTGALLALPITLTGAPSETPPTPSPSKSVIRIMTTSLEPDYRLPWNPGSVSGGVGAGFIIEDQRIMTNAHVVSNARYIVVSKDGDPRNYRARVQHIAHDCDLALLEVEDASFFEGTMPLDFGGIPAMESTVSVYGYPIGGDRMSVTRGVVSRIDFQSYSHSAADAHLTIQIDAAINPGNSGGPVMQDGKVVGVAFQGYSGDVAQNVGYMIPTPVIRRFLQDVSDGKYDRYVDLALSYFPLANAAMRRALGLPDDHSGVLVGDVYGGGSSHGKIFPGDVLLSIDGHPIASDGSVQIDGEVVPLAEIVERKFKGDKVDLEVLREGERKAVSISLDEPWPFYLHANAYDEKPRFVVYGGLVFQPVDQNFMSAHNPDSLRLRYFFERFIIDHIYEERPELIVLSSVLPDPINTYASEYRYSLVDEINGKKINRLEDVAAAFDEENDLYVIKLIGDERPIVLKRSEAEAARERILARYRIPSERNLQP